ncbi:MAG: hypothetical protein GWP91_03805 [Rhodobacterales bacterium]|nr:hypothetical protein [Rhodobacterales bacterium]
MSISSWAMVNGVAMPLEQAQIPVTDPAVTIGWSVFETLRSDDSGTPRRLPQHLARLKRSCQTATIEMQDESHISAEVLEVAQKLGAARIRITLSGSGFRVVVGQTFDRARFGQPVRAARGIWRDEPYLGGSVKHSSRAPWVAAVRRSGVDEVLLVDDQGRFTEGTASSIFAVVDGALWTAPHDGRVLESTTCVEVLERAQQLGIPVNRQGALADGPWDGLYIASTTRDLAPVVELDGQSIAHWDEVGRTLAYRD